jgi:hypothetical protein
LFCPISPYLFLLVPPLYRHQYFGGSYCFLPQDKRILKELHLNYSFKCVHQNIHFFPMARQPLGGLGCLIFRGLTITLFRHTTLGTTPLDEGPVPHRDLRICILKDKLSSEALNADFDIQRKLLLKKCNKNS